jgi:tyrosyl-tRNA synthetase
MTPDLDGCHVLDVLTERGFVQQTTDRGLLRSALAAPGLTFYVGFDPTGESLHVGHLLPMMAMRWLREAGHRPVVLMGGGTARVGDPSGKDRTRELLDDARIEANLEGQRPQFVQVLGPLYSVSAKDWASEVPGPEAGALVVNNADWLMGWGYIDFLREVGRHFSVNRMLTAEGLRQRLGRDQGLSFIEFNYHLLQSFDYLELWRRLGCTLQLGGDDQWFNILGGVDLVRRSGGPVVHGLTTPLLVTSDGRKMGKTERGALFLSGALTSPFEFYQYWINVSDADVGRFLRLYTFLPMKRVAELEALTGADLREAKRVLAFEVTAIVHGLDAALRASEAAQGVFSGASESAPEVQVARFPITVVEALVAAGLVKGRGEAHRLIGQGGVRLGGERVVDPELMICGPTLLWKGKKQVVRLV